MKFSEEHNYKVKLHHRDLGDLGEAQLKFGGEWGVVATGMGLLSAGWVKNGVLAAVTAPRGRRRWRE